MWLYCSVLITVRGSPHVLASWTLNYRSHFLNTGGSSDSMGLKTPSSVVSLNKKPSDWKTLLPVWALTGFRLEVNAVQSPAPDRVSQLTSEPNVMLTLRNCSCVQGCSPLLKGRLTASTDLHVKFGGWKYEVVCTLSCLSVRSGCLGLSLMFAFPPCSSSYSSSLPSSCPPPFSLCSPLSFYIYTFVFLDSAVLLFKK